MYYYYFYYIRVMFFNVLIIKRVYKYYRPYINVFNFP